MTLRTALVITGDSDEAVSAVNRVDQAMDAAEASSKDLSASIARTEDAIEDLTGDAARASTELDNYANSSARAAAEQRLIAQGASTAGKQWERASIALGRVSDEQREVAASSAAMGRASRAANDDIDLVAKSSGAAGFAARQLSFQMGDVITMYAMGAKPMQIFASQGFQIVDALVLLKGAANDNGTSIAGMIGNYVKGNPILLAAGVAVAALAAGVGLLTAEINQNAEVQVSWGDTLLGIYDVVSAALYDKVGAAFDAMGITAGEAWDFVVKVTKTAVNLIIGAVNVVPNVIRATWDKIGPAMGDAFYAGANLAIGALNKLAQMSAAPLNAIIGAMNTAFGTSIPKVVMGGIDKIANPYAGALGRLGSAAAGAAVKSFTTDYVGGMASAFSEAAQARARSRKAAEDSGSKLGSAAGKAAGSAAGKSMADEWAKALDDIQGDTAKAIAGITGQTAAIVADLMKASDAEFDAILSSLGTVEEAQGGWNEEIERTLGLLGQLGRGGDTLSQILLAFQGLKTGDFSGVGGSAGVLLNTLGNIQWTGTKDGERYIYKLGEEIFGVMDRMFGGGGKFEQTLNTLFQGAATGSAVGAVLGGGKAGQLGGMLGGAAGQAIGSSIAALGSFGGPIGSIVGAIAGNLLGSVLTSTKRGGATIGAGGVTGTWGNSQSRIGAASGIGGNAVDALQQIAAALGVELGSFSSSVSVRKNDLRFDPSGSGISKTSKGAISFGQDEAALMKAVIVDAIKDGALPLGQGFVDYITSGDVEQRLQDVLGAKSIQDEAARMRDPQAFDLAELDKWRDKWVEVFTATGQDLADLEFVYGEKRKEILGAANDDSLEREREIRDKRIELLVAQGRIEEAEAAARQARIDDMPDYLRSIQMEIDAATDLAAARAEEARVADLAAQAAAERAATALRNAQQDFALDQRLASARGDSQHVQHLQRENELREATSELVRQRLLEIYAVEDLTAAQAAAAASQARIEQEAYGLDTRILTLLGDETALKARELDLLDPVNRAKQEYVWQLEAEVSATAAAAQAAAELAARNKAIADEIGGLNRQWLELTGQTGKVRELDLAALQSDEARQIQQRIWDYTDALQQQKDAQEAAARAAQEHNSRLETARNALSAAYERESSALQGSIDKMRGLAGELASFRQGLSYALPGYGDASLASAQAAYRKTATLTGLGNEDSARSFAGDARAYLDAALGNAGSIQDYQRAVAQVERDSRAGERALLGIAGGAQAQLDVMRSQVSELIDLNEKTLGVTEAIKQLREIQEEAVLPAFVGSIDTGFEGVKAELSKGNQAAQTASSKQEERLSSVEKSLSELLDIFRRANTGRGLIIRTDADEPLQTQIVNTAAAPVPVDQV